jgi:hypothetical protein
MLELRPSCEHCNKSLAPDALDARICSFECTFCARCVDGLLGGVCPNCGGGFSPRPVRPVKNWNSGNFLGVYPASTAVKFRPVDLAAHEKFAAEIRKIAFDQR